MQPRLLLLVVSGVLLAIRIYAASKVGFGDSEALYASWAIHPQPAYLDHPGLVGLVARAIGEGAIPTPFRTHIVTAVLATLVPWLVVLVSRLVGAEMKHAVIAGVVVALVPEIAVGLFALTPDLLLAPLWLGAIGLAIVGLKGGGAESNEEKGELEAEDAPAPTHKGAKQPPRKAREKRASHGSGGSGGDKSESIRRASIPSNRAAGALLGAGLLAGVAASAKVSGLLLFLSLAIAYMQIARNSRKTSPRGVREDEARSEAERGSVRENDHQGASHSISMRVARSLWPWAGLFAGAVVVAPFVLYEARLGLPMLHHRLIATQHDAMGIAERVFTNVAALVGGQLVYLSPVVAGIAVLIARDLLQRRNDDVASRVLFWSFAIPLLPLLALCLWSPVAEPHWIAPPLLALPIHAARRATHAAPQFFLRRTLLRVGAAIAGTITLAAHAWVLVPASAQLLPSSVDPKVDISSELYGWPAALEAIKDQMAQASTPYDVEGREVVVVGPHWTICAQLHAALPGVRIGCTTPIPDDFDRWLPRETWRRADHVLFVTDNRFPGDGSEQLPAHVRASQSRVRVLRGGRTSRVFELYLYSRRQSASHATD